MELRLGQVRATAGDRGLSRERDGRRDGSVFFHKDDGSTVDGGGLRAMEYISVDGWVIMFYSEWNDMKMRNGHGFLGR